MPEQHERHWNCPRCTFRNSRGVSTCEMCDFTRVDGGSCHLRVKIDHLTELLIGMEDAVAAAENMDEQLKDLGRAITKVIRETQSIIGDTQDGSSATWPDRGWRTQAHYHTAVVRQFYESSIRHGDLLPRSGRFDEGAVIVASSSRSDCEWIKERIEAEIPGADATVVDGLPEHAIPDAPFGNPTMWMRSEGLLGQVWQATLRHLRRRNSGRREEDSGSRHTGRTPPFSLRGQFSLSVYNPDLDPDIEASPDRTPTDRLLEQMRSAMHRASGHPHRPTHSSTFTFPERGWRDRDEFWAEYASGVKGNRGRGLVLRETNRTECERVGAELLKILRSEGLDTHAKRCTVSLHAPPEAVTGRSAEDSALLAPEEITQAYESKGVEPPLRSFGPLKKEQEKKRRTAVRAGAVAARDKRRARGSQRAPALSIARLPAPPLELPTVAPPPPTLRRSVTYETMVMQHSDADARNVIAACLYPELELKPVARRVKAALPKVRIQLIGTGAGAGADDGAKTTSATSATSATGTDADTSAATNAEASAGDASDASASGRTSGEGLSLCEVCSDEVCPICQGEWATDDVAVRLRCGHCMHEECMQQCLDYNNACPVCRTPIAEDDDKSNKAKPRAREEEREPEPSSMDDEDDEDDAETMGGHWRCIGCTLENPDRARCCSSCGVSRAAANMAALLRRDFFPKVLVLSVFHELLDPGANPSLTHAHARSEVCRAMRSTLECELHGLLTGEKMRGFKLSGWEFADAVEDIVLGERDGTVLADGCDRNSAQVMLKLLQQLNSRQGRQIRGILRLHTEVFEEEGAGKKDETNAGVDAKETNQNDHSWKCTACNSCNDSQSQLCERCDAATSAVGSPTGSDGEHFFDAASEETEEAVQASAPTVQTDLRAARQLLAEIQQQSQNPGAVKDTLKVLQRLVGNVAKEPNRRRFRTVRLSNSKIKKQVCTVPKAIELLKAMGFKEVDDGVKVLQMEPVLDVDVPSFSSMSKLLDEAASAAAVAAVPA